MNQPSLFPEEQEGLPLAGAVLGEGVAQATTAYQTHDSKEGLGSNPDCHLGVIGCRGNLECVSIHCPIFEMTRRPSAPPRKQAVRLTVRRYSLLMELKLRKNDFKGGWQDMQPHHLLGLLKKEVQELEEALASGDPLDIAQECADIGNYAMMIADVTEGI